MAERYYDPNNAEDRGYHAKVAGKVKGFIPEFLSGSPNGCAYLGDIRVGFEERYPGLCDDTILRSEISRQPKWHHAIDNALQNMKKQGIVIGGRDTETELWCHSRPENDDVIQDGGMGKLDGR